MSEMFVGYSYLDWYYSKANADKKYEDYADLLRILQATHPKDRLVIKLIEHLENPHMIRKHIPNAKPIQTHRQPIECVPSNISLNSIICNLSCDDQDKPV